MADGIVHESALGKLTASVRDGEMTLVRTVNLMGAAGPTRDRLEKAAQWAEAVLDESVVPVLGVERRDDELVVISRHIPGMSVAQLLTRSRSEGLRVPLPAALRAVSDILEALDVAHEQPKPSDDEPRFGGVCPDGLWVGEDGRTRLFELGISAIASSVGPYADDVGRVRYRAPEAVGDDAQCTVESDIFSVGALLWEMLTGRPVFGTDELAETLMRVIGDEIPRLEGVPDAVADVVARALDRDPERRFHRAIDMIEAVEELGAGDSMSVSHFLEELDEDDLDESPTRLRTAPQEPDDQPTMLKAAPSDPEDKPTVERRVPHDVLRHAIDLDESTSIVEVPKATADALTDEDVDPSTNVRELPPDAMAQAEALQKQVDEDHEKANEKKQNEPPGMAKKAGLPKPVGLPRPAAKDKPKLAQKKPLESKKKPLESKKKPLDDKKSRKRLPPRSKRPGALPGTKASKPPPKKPIGLQIQNAETIDDLEVELSTSHSEVKVHVGEAPTRKVSPETLEKALTSDEDAPASEPEPASVPASEPAPAAATESESESAPASEEEDAAESVPSVAPVAAAERPSQSDEELVVIPGEKSRPGIAKWAVLAAAVVVFGIVWASSSSDAPESSDEPRANASEPVRPDPVPIAPPPTVAPEPTPPEPEPAPAQSAEEEEEEDAGVEDPETASSAETESETPEPDEPEPDASAESEPPKPPPVRYPPRPWPRQPKPKPKDWKVPTGI